MGGVGLDCAFGFLVLAACRWGEGLWVFGRGFDETLRRTRFLRERLPLFWASEFWLRAFGFAAGICGIRTLAEQMFSSIRKRVTGVFWAPGLWA